MCSTLFCLSLAVFFCTTTTLFCTNKTSNFLVVCAARFFVFPLQIFCTTTTLFCTTKTSNFLVTHYIYRGIVVCAYPKFGFLCCVHVRFYFSLPLIFTLLSASIFHFLTAALKFHVFLPTEFVSFVFNNSL